MTGSLELTTGNGTSRMVLIGPTNPFITYKAVLVQ